MSKELFTAMGIATIETCPGCGKSMTVDDHVDLRTQGYDLNLSNQIMHWYCLVDQLKKELLAAGESDV